MQIENAFTLREWELSSLKIHGATIVYYSSSRLGLQQKGRESYYETTTISTANNIAEILMLESDCM